MLSLQPVPRSLTHFRQGRCSRAHPLLLEHDAHVVQPGREYEVVHVHYLLSKELAAEALHMDKVSLGLQDM